MLTKNIAVRAALAALITFTVSSSYTYHWLTLKQERAQYLQHRDVLQQSSLLRAKLEASLNSTLHLTEGIYTYIAVNTNIDQKTFNQMAQRLLLNNDNIINIGLAPDFVLKYIYPLKGNEKALGLKFKESRQQLAAVLDARYSRHTVLAGPIPLVQGGVGLIARTPIFTPSLSINPKEHYWGMASVVIDWEKIKESTGLNQADQYLHIAIRGRDGLGENGEVFHGDAQLFTTDSIFTKIHLGKRSWQMAIKPVDGWANQNTVKTSKLIFSALVNFIIALITFLLLHQLLKQGQYARQVEQVQQRQKETIDTIKDNLQSITQGLNKEGNLHELIITLENIIRLNKTDIAIEKNTFTLQSVLMQLPSQLNPLVENMNSSITYTVENPEIHSNEKTLLRIISSIVAGSLYLVESADIRLFSSIINEHVKLDIIVRKKQTSTSNNSALKTQFLSSVRYQIAQQLCQQLAINIELEATKESGLCISLSLAHPL